MAQPVVVQPIPDRPAVDAQLAGDLCKRPCPLDHAVGQIRLEAGRASTASPSLGRQRNLSGEAESPPCQHELRHFTPINH